MSLTDRQDTALRELRMELQLEEGRNGDEPWASVLVSRIIAGDHDRQDALDFSALVREMDAPPLALRSAARRLRAETNRRKR